MQSLRSLKLLLFLAISSLTLAASEQVDFVRDIQPIFKASCYSCHGPEKQKGELRLDSKPLAMQGGSTGAAILPGKSADSLLLKRVQGVGDDPRMPLKAEPLSPQKIALLAAWIDAGAPWPDDASVPGARIEKHWAYVSPVRPPPPDVKNGAWVRNPLDRFILARLEKEELAPSPEAPRETLLRRLSLDLVGLPPSFKELDEFLADKSPGAYEKAVERLLASPQYGERWARPWLDLARYGDTDGFEFDKPRTMWKYRDGVIAALNRDMSFKQFTIEQIAGDMLPNTTIEQKIASGFHRNTRVNDEGGVDKEEARWETLLDRVNTTATVWLGSTLACAQCHNHKYDPFKQKEYYQFLAFFDNSNELSLRIPLEGNEERRKKLAAEIADLEKKGAAKDRLAQRRQQLKILEATTALVMQEREGKEPETDFHVRGSYVNKGEKLHAATPAFLPPFAAGEPRNRLGLARWLADEKNPLTARVTVNRIWEQYFGTGIVETSEDFGTQGSRPAHPELLDWLAVEFMERGWSLKAIHRLIVTSATYRQSSRLTPVLKQRDPMNKLLARGPRYRMEAEMIRDAALSCAGQLCLKMGGPSVFPPQPDDKGFIPNNKGSDKWVVSSGEDRYRRGIYTFWRRTAPYPAFATFDATSREFCTVRRSRTNTPLQALVALNDPAFFDAAKALARRMAAEAGTKLEERIRYGFRLCTARYPGEEELAPLLAGFREDLAQFQNDAPAAAALTSEFQKPLSGDAAELAALVMAANVLLNMDETITRE